MAALKGNVVRRLGLGRVGALAEQAELPRHDFSPVALTACVLRLVLAGSKPSFDVDLPAFGQESLARIGEPAECDDAMPFGALLLQTAPIRETLGGCQREIRHILTGIRQSPNLGVSAKIPDYDHFVD